MKGRLFFAGLFLVFGLELAMLALLTPCQTGSPQDTVAVNEIVQTVQRDWDFLGDHTNGTGFDYVVLDGDDTVRYRTKPGPCWSSWASARDISAICAARWCVPSAGWSTSPSGWQGQSGHPPGNGPAQPVWSVHRKL